MHRMNTLWVGLLGGAPSGRASEDGAITARILAQNPCCDHPRLDTLRRQ